jgi:hypothetical protein
VLPTADDPKGYTQSGGVKNVAKSGLTRIEVTGLKYGVKGGHQAGYVNWRGKTVPSFEKKMTKESPDNVAVVIMPDPAGPETADAGHPAFSRLGIPQDRSVRPEPLPEPSPVSEGP